MVYGTEPEIHMTGTKKTETRESTNQLTNDDTMTRLDHAIGGAETRASDKFTGHCSTCRAWPTRSSVVVVLCVGCKIQLLARENIEIYFKILSSTLF